MDNFKLNYEIHKHILLELQSQQLIKIDETTEIIKYNLSCKALFFMPFHYLL